MSMSASRAQGVSHAPSTSKILGSSPHPWRNGNMEGIEKQGSSTNHNTQILMAEMKFLMQGRSQMAGAV